MCSNTLSSQVSDTGKILWKYICEPIVLELADKFLLLFYYMLYALDIESDGSSG